jgi:hypothetical protein
MGFETGGWAPKRFMTEDGPKPVLLENYGLKESGLDYVGRTNLNTRNSDVTIWFGTAGTPGYHATSRSCHKNGKKFIEAKYSCDKYLAEVIKSAGIVNIAGNRESNNPGIFIETRKRMISILKIVKEQPGGP